MSARMLYRRIALTRMTPPRHIVLDVDVLTALEPGHCLEIRLVTGEQFTIMHSDDTTHVLSLGGLTTRDRGLRNDK